jgi:ribosomal-protein-alanine N-acetyltransferase
MIISEVLFMPTFRELNSSDLNSCYEIMANLKSHYDHPVGGEWTLSKISDELNQHHGMGAFNENGDLLAFCLFRRAADVVEIMLLATAPRDHRTGAMRALIRSLIADLTPQETIWLEVHGGNIPAVNLYDSLGFISTGSRQNYYKDGGTALLYQYKPLQ